MNSINNMNNNVQFEGLAALRLASTAKRKSCAQLVSNVLDQEEKDILNLTKNATNGRINFIRNLADKYNKDNFYRSVENKENSQLVNQIFEMVKFPMNAHNYLADNFQGSLEGLYRIFSKTGLKYKRMHFAEKVNREILHRHPKSYQDMLPELLESPNSKEYVRNYKKYKSYLKLNRYDANVVKNLDEMVENRTYDSKRYDILYKSKKIREHFMLPETEVFNADHFVNNYSKAGESFLEYVAANFVVNKELLASGADKIIFDMYKTCSDKNIDLRINTMEVLNNIKLPGKDSQLQTSQLYELKTLYDKVDNDPYARKFLEDYVNNPSYNCISINSMNKVLSEIPTRKLAIFSSNAKRILSQASRDTRINTLNNELENPFFETEFARMSKDRAIKCGFAKKDSSLKKFFIKIKNDFKILQYKYLESTGKLNVLDSKPTSTFEELTPIKQSNSFDLLERHIEVDVIKIKKEAELDSENSVVKKKIGREEVRKNIFGIISSKLGPKTYAKQQDQYGAYATKLRLSLLPEIFASVADTRKADRAVGKHRINSSNKDVLDLYVLINGNNKKYVNYLLKKRNVDNTRMFEIKDIISMLKKAELKIQKDKQVNPEYRAIDARRYYNHLYESKLQQYGKLKRTVNAKA